MFRTVQSIKFHCQWLIANCSKRAKTFAIHMNHPLRFTSKILHLTVVFWVTFSFRIHVQALFDVSCCNFHIIVNFIVCCRTITTRCHKLLLATASHLRHCWWYRGQLATLMRHRRVRRRLHAADQTLPTSCSTQSGWLPPRSRPPRGHQVTVASCHVTPAHVSWKI